MLELIDIVIITDQSVAEDYEKEFQRVWAQASA